MQICSARQIGGGEKHLADLSNALQGRGHEIFFALAPDSPVEKLLENVESKNVLLTKMRNALDVFAARRIARFVAQNNIEIIHAHIARDYPIAALAAKISRKPFVLTRHVLFPLNRLQKYALQNVGGIIAPSKAIADALRRQNLFSSESIETIYNGIDLKHFAPTNKEPTAILPSAQSDISRRSKVTIFSSAPPRLFGKSEQIFDLLSSARTNQNQAKIAAHLKILSRKIIYKIIWNFEAGRTTCERF